MVEWYHFFGCFRRRHCLQFLHTFVSVDFFEYNSINDFSFISISIHSFSCFSLHPCMFLHRQAHRANVMGSIQYIYCHSGDVAKMRYHFGNLLSRTYSCWLALLSSLSSRQSHECRLAKYLTTSCTLIGLVQLVFNCFQLHSNWIFTLDYLFSVFLLSCFLLFSRGALTFSPCICKHMMVSFSSSVDIRFGRILLN